ncbi:MAG: hypothetical protein R3D98_04250 [Candidatus Krumholzibacteriia bacterium]
MTLHDRRLVLLAVGALLVLASGCATHTRKMLELRPRLADGEYDRALALVDQEMGGKDRALAALERGLILRQAGRWQESNVAFEEAERLADELYGTSVSESAISLFTNDTATSYRPRPFELAMVPYYRALNYLALGLPDDALVEARKASLLLAGYVDVTVGAIQDGDTSALARTRNDPFLLYFSGMLYDWDGELNDAFIAYRNAAVAYEDLAGLVGVTVPPWLGRDLERVAARLGFGAELEPLRQSCPEVFRAAEATPPTALTPGRGELVLLVENGWIAAKGESKLSLPIFASDRYDDNERWAWVITDRARHHVVVSDREVAYWLSVAMPTAPVSLTPDRPVSLRDPEGRTIRSVRAHHPSTVARITADAESGMVLFRAVLRSLVKYLSYRAANKEGKGLGLLVNIFNVASEVADTRSWLTLPDHLQLLRVSLPAGVYDLDLRLEDTDGRQLGVVTVPQVRIVAGDWTFRSHRIYNP